MRRRTTYRLVQSGNVFKVSLIVVSLTVLGVYFWGLGRHNTFYENSLVSTSILSIAFFSFITIGLYNGIKLRDDLGSIVDRYKVIDTTDISSNFVSSGPIEAGDGIGGIILGVLLWIVMAVVFAAALWIFTNVLVFLVLAFAAMLYWIFFRALRLVFRNANRSKGDLFESVRLGLWYTVLYNFWIYGIFFLTTYFRN